MKTNFHWKMRFCEGKNPRPPTLHVMIVFIVWLNFSSVEKKIIVIIIFILLIKFFAFYQKIVKPFRKCVS